MEEDFGQWLQHITFASCHFSKRTFNNRPMRNHKRNNNGTAAFGCLKEKDPPQSNECVRSRTKQRDTGFNKKELSYETIVGGSRRGFRSTENRPWVEVLIASLPNSKQRKKNSMEYLLLTPPNLSASLQDVLVKTKRYLNRNAKRKFIQMMNVSMAQPLCYQWYFNRN